jgi:hypothetical protein
MIVPAIFDPGSKGLHLHRVKRSVRLLESHGD